MSEKNEQNHLPIVDAKNCLNDNILPGFEEIIKQMATMKEDLLNMRVECAQLQMKVTMNMNPVLKQNVESMKAITDAALDMEKN